MVVRLRLARFGRKNLPFYRVFVADSRAPRDGKHIEVVGHYDPLPGKDGMKRIGVNSERIKYWLSVGAQPSDTVARLLGKAGILPSPPRRQSTPRIVLERAAAAATAAAASQAAGQSPPPVVPPSDVDGNIDTVNA